MGSVEAKGFYLMFLYSERQTLGWFTLGWDCCLHPVQDLSTTALFPGIKEFTTGRKYYRVLNAPRVCLEARFNFFFKFASIFNLTVRCKKIQSLKTAHQELQQIAWNSSLCWHLLWAEPDLPLASAEWNPPDAPWGRKSLGSSWGDRSPSSKRSLCPKWTVL